MWIMAVDAKHSICNNLVVHSCCKSFFAVTFETNILKTLSEQRGVCRRVGVMASETGSNCNRSMNELALDEIFVAQVADFSFGEKEFVLGLKVMTPLAVFFLPWPVCGSCFLLNGACLFPVSGRGFGDPFFVIFIEKIFYVVFAEFLDGREVWYPVKDGGQQFMFYERVNF